MAQFDHFATITEWANWCHGFFFLIYFLLIYNPYYFDGLYKAERTFKFHRRLGDWEPYLPDFWDIYYPWDTESWILISIWQCHFQDSDLGQSKKIEISFTTNAIWKCNIKENVFSSNIQLIRVCCVPCKLAWSALCYANSARHCQHVMLICEMVVLDIFFTLALFHNIFHTVR